MGNPFDLSGPPFLLFYIVLGLGLNLFLRHLFLRREAENPDSLRVISDPYKLAALRAGAEETLRIVLFSLIDRGLLKAAGRSVAAEAGAEVVKAPVEQAVISYFAIPRAASDLLSDRVALQAAKTYSDELAAEGLLADAAVLERRRGPALSVAVILLSVSVAKICIAFSRGRHNVGFLVVLTLVFIGWAAINHRKQRTGAGDEVLRRARVRFATLKESAGRIRPGGMTLDASLVAALFGLTVLPAPYFPYLTTLFPQSTSCSDSYSGSGDSSSGCGGGGCGGGGGGCGGCGG